MNVEQLQRILSELDPEMEIVVAPGMGSAKYEPLHDHDVDVEIAECYAERFYVYRKRAHEANVPDLKEVLVLNVRV